jgi:hypothetical protein
MITTQPVIGIEFVGLVANRVQGKGWSFLENDWEFIESCLKGFRALRDNDCYILIHTVLINSEVDIETQKLEIESYLKKREVPYHSIHIEVGKPLMDFEVDFPEDIWHYLENVHKY